jgi:hypothetical protein
MSYSTTSSARERIEAGTVSLIAFALFRFKTISNLTGRRWQREGN